MTALQSKAEARSASLDPLMALVAEDMSAVNQVIVDRMQSPVSLIPTLAGHIVAAGGKRLRPMLTLATAKLCGYGGARHQNLAACVEFIHTATLLHDDVVDESDLRRGRDTANAIWGNKPSVLVGDFLFSRAFELMVEDGSLEVLRVLSQASATIAEGEVHQLMTTGDVETDEQAYLQVIHGKTAALFAAACEVGAIVAERPAAEQEALRLYGESLGMAFQLVDDVLDYEAEQTTLGKAVGDDFREGKMTLPVVLAYARGGQQDRAFWKRCLEDLDQREGDLEHALRLLQNTGALTDSIERAKTFALKAEECLEAFEQGPARGALSEAAAFNVQRLY